ncbi:MAG: transporter [Pseudomonadota bacterium]|nr:transporter [Pseudomonadota bacterium]
MKTTRTQNHIAAALGCALTLTVTTLVAQDAAAEDEKAKASELAMKLQNPVASLISVPIQNNWDFGIGAADAMRYTANVQPVIPFSISENWNLITRTILPIVYAESPVKGGDSKFGLGDTVQSLFFSPKAPTSGGWIWGAGPVLLWPTSTDDALGTGKVGAGPTALLLRQEKGWTYGALANHLWSFAGQGSTADVNATFLQPFVSYTTKTFTTFGLNTESTYDWENNQWTAPLNLQVSQLLKLGKQPIQLTLGGRYYAEKPEGGPDWGLRFVVTFLFPK